jgi:chemotaxis protein methyltransferase CheR
MRALGDRLAAGGSLLLGHAEATLSDPVLALPPQFPTEFEQALRPPVAPPYVPPVLPPPSEPYIGISIATLPPASEAVSSDGEDEALAKLQALADAGAYEEAERLCRDLIAVNPTSARLQFYDAVLRQVSDDLPGAEAALRRAIYLDRSFAVAHHRLGVLMLGLGRTDDARRSLLAAARLAEAARPGDMLREGQGVSAGEFGDVVRRQLQTLGAAA